MQMVELTRQEIYENQHAQDCATEAFLARMQGTQAMALYLRCKHGETIRVRTKPLVSHEESRTFEIEPLQFLGFSIGYTIWFNGKPDREHRRKPISQGDFLDWMTMLEAVK